MRLPAAILTALLLEACATHPLPAGQDRSPPLCVFGSAVWEHAAPLEVPGGAFVYARANANGAYPPTAHGAVLHLHGQPDAHAAEPLDAVLELSLERDGYTLWAQTSVRDHPLLSTEAGFAVGDFGQVMPGAPVKVVGGSPGELEVQPASWSTEDFTPLSLPPVRVKCEDLVMHTHQRSPGIEDQELAQLKLAPVLREALIAPGADVELRASAGDGPVRGILRAHPEGHFVRVLEEKDGWSKVVAAHWVGVYWFGWVRSAQLRPAADEKPAPEPVAPGGSPPATLPKGQRCERALDLFVEKGGARQPIGRLAKNTAFTLLGGDGELAVLDTRGQWFTLEEGVRLEVPEKARACPPSK